MAIQCTTSNIGVGRTCKKENSLTVMKGDFLSVPGFEFDSFSSFGTEADWVTAIAAGYLYPIHGIKLYEDQRVDDGVFEGDTGQKSLMYFGANGYMFSIKSTLQDHKAYKTYHNGDWRIFKYDGNNNILGTSPDGTVVKGFSLDYITVKNHTNATADQPAFTQFEIQESNNKEWNDNGVYLENADFLASSLKGVVRCTISASVIATAEFTLTVTYDDNSALSGAGVVPSSPILGLEAANVIVTDQTGAVSAADSVDDSSPATGVYTVALAGLTSGSVILLPSSALLFDSVRLTIASA